MTDADASSIRSPGAYGFRLQLVDGVAGLPYLVDVGFLAPTVYLSWVREPVTEDVRVVDDSIVRLGRAGSALMVVRRAERSIRLVQLDRLTADAVVHPFMTAPMAMHARWHGRITLHAGAVMIDGAAFGVSGEQAAGKSTMLACLAERGLPVVADDLLVVDGQDVLSGPNCLDLRPDAARRLPGTRSLGVVGQRVRHRLVTRPAPARLPFKGLFLLEWSDDAHPHVEPLSTSEKLLFLHKQDYAAILGPSPPVQTLRILGLPMWRLTRPRSWQATDAAIQCLLGCVADAVA